MQETLPSPSRLLRAVAWLARWSLGLMLVALVVLAAAWGALYGWIVPRIDEYRVPLQEQAGRALGVPVRVGALTARRDGLLPVIEMHGVALLDAQGRAALRLPRVVVAVSPRSLWRLGFEQLYIDRPELDVRRTQDGRILVAGLPFSDAPAGDTQAADWLFAQTEVVIRGGTLRWTDELRAAPPLALQQVDVLLRNGNWRHSLHLAATPPPAWGQRFAVVGKFRQPLLAVRSGHWQQWTGQVFANFAQVDVSRLRQHLDLGSGVVVAQGRGAVRAWLDVERGQPVAATADLALADVNATLGQRLQPLALDALQGRLGGRRRAQGWDFSTQGLQFRTADGLRWPGGNLRLQYSDASHPQGEHGDLHADRLDLAALAQIAGRLPLGDAVHGALRTYAPKGQVEVLHASWQGPLEALRSYQASARVAGLELAADPAPAAAQGGVPGLRGASVDVDMTQAGGKATLAIAKGALVFPGIFEDPVVPLERLGAELRWQIDGPRIAVQVDDVRFANDDAQGELRATWRTSDPARSGSRSRFPGVLDLAGTLTRADGTRVHRYLPLVIPADARHYVRDAVVAGSASRVDFRVKGDLHDMPFENPRQGQFRIAAQVQNATYAFVPPGLQREGELPWPALEKLAGELVFERAGMRVQGASGLFAGTRNTQIHKVSAHIADLSHTVVEVAAQLRGPLPELLGVVQTSPVGGLIEHALDQASATGSADVRLDLRLPISDLHTTSVRGSVALGGGDVRITPDTPAMTGARGTVQFTEKGFALQGVRARALGGEVRLEGGLQALPAGAPPTDSALQVRAQGVASAQGLQQAGELGLLAQLAHQASGQTPYSMALTLRRGVPEVLVQTDLQGLALHLPAPLAKSADSALPVRFATQVTREALAVPAAGAAAPPLQDQWSVDWGTVGAVTYVRDLEGALPRVLRGSIAVGLAPGESAHLPAQGVAANVQLAHIDVDAWQDALSPRATASAGAAPAAAPAVEAAADYLPTVLAVRAQTVTLQQRTLHNVVVGGSRAGSVWRANLDARELGGYLEYRPPGSPQAPAGLVFARLARLTVPDSAASAVSEPDAVLVDPPGSLPALDIVVNDFELRGRKLGHLQIEATHRAGVRAQRDWQLRKFNITTPEAVLTASGNWAPQRPSAAAVVAAAAPTPRHTALNFRLDVRDSGELLQRFGMAGVLRRGKGSLQGQVGWRGTPFSPDYATMAGQIHLDMESGQFLKAEPGLAKLLSVLSLQSLPRRLALDFRDVFSDGFAFDFVRGDVQIAQGIAMTNNLQMKGVNAAVLMEGRADIDHETQDLHVVVVPEINAMTASLVATAINPVIGLGSFLAQVFLRGPLIAAATQEFRIDGTWADPQVVRLPRRSQAERAQSAGAGAVPGAVPGAAAPPAAEPTTEPPGEAP